MSGAIESRAAVFTSEPQAIEVYQGGGWWPGELLGWRHDSAGACQVWVRVVLGGVVETAWTDLATLRLPERHLAAAPDPVTAAPATQEMSAMRDASAPRRLPGADGLAATSLPVVRELSVVPEVGARTRSGGRRRAPEDDQVVAVAARPAVPAPGRHRAPSDTGRHRAADTGLFPAVGAGAPASDAQPAAPLRSGRRRAPATETFAAVTSRSEARPEEERGWSAPADPEPELLTRPMRLSDRIPHARRPRLDGSLSSV